METKKIVTFVEDIEVIGVSEPEVDAENERDQMY